MKPFFGPFHDFYIPGSRIDFNVTKVHLDRPINKNELGFLDSTRPGVGVEATPISTL